MPYRNNTFTPHGDSQGDVEFLPWGIESNGRSLMFRNQYGELFIFGSQTGYRSVMVATFMTGCIAGFVAAFIVLLAR